MGNKLTSELLLRIKALEEGLNMHLIEGSQVKNDIKWLKWINMGIAALVLFKLVSDWITK